MGRFVYSMLVAVGSELARLKEETAGDLDIGGPMLAAAAIRLGLVGEFRASGSDSSAQPMAVTAAARPIGQNR
jgi:hypothetical protein